MTGQEAKSYLPKPQTDNELHQFIIDYVGIEIPRVQVCENHVAPFTALADAYFARSPVAIWKASRGFGGKTVNLAVLSFVELIVLGASISLLGGSEEQSKRAHEYQTNEETNMPNTFWLHPQAPRELLLTAPTQRGTRLVNGGWLRVLKASGASVRGPHPQRLRLDEADETKIGIVDSALGQPMEARGISEQVVISSTHHHANGTMTKKLREAADRGWPVYEWCYRENLEPHGWLTKASVEAKRTILTASTWKTEIENQEPNPEGRAIDPDKMEEMFRKELGVYKGALHEYIEIEKPFKGDPAQNKKPGKYATGADWARTVDYTIIITIRYDVTPWRVVAFRRTGRMDWPAMIKLFETQVKRFPGGSMHDATGIGDVIDQYMRVGSEGFKFVGQQRADLLSEYITGIENGEVIAPQIEFMYNGHKYASWADVYGGMKGTHLPDDIAAGALAYRKAKRGRVGKGI